MLAWGIFGLTLSALLCLGVLNIIFSMDFKAFFTHKRQIAAVLAVTLLISFAFNWDWMGYDDYLPDKEEIAEIGVWTGEFSNRYTLVDFQDSPLFRMRFQDTDAIYAYLERAIEEEPQGVWINLPTRVTLKSGRSYYRRYCIDSRDKDLLWPLLSHEEYVEYAFCISQEMLERCEKFELQRQGYGEIFSLRDFGPEAFWTIIQAYNRDVLENPEGAFQGKGRRLASLEFNAWGRAEISTMVRISIYDTMEYTLEALENAGLGEWAAAPDPGEITAISLSLPGNYEEMTAEEMTDLARKYYGLAGDQEDQEEQEKAELFGETIQATPDREFGLLPALEITDRALIEELWALMDYSDPCRSDSLFREGGVEVSCLDREGNSLRCYLPMGVLPEKYILMFGDCS